MTHDNQQPKTEAPPTGLRIPAAAQRLGLHPQTIHTLRRRGILQDLPRDAWSDRRSPEVTEESVDAYAARQAARRAAGDKRTKK